MTAIFTSTINDLSRYHTLVLALFNRHLAARYRGSSLGFLWSFLNPLCLMAVYILVFRFYMRFEGVPNYTFFVFVGLLPWLWSSSALSEGTGSIVGCGHLVTKSMFPAHILPAVTVATTAVHFLLSLLMLLVYMLVMGLPFHLTLLALPLLIAVQGLFLYGCTLALASLNVGYRDVQHVLGNLLTLIFFLTPIIYPPTQVPEAFRFSLTINPFALITTAYHTLIIDGQLPPWQQIATLFGYALITLTVGLLIYYQDHDRFAEKL